MIEQAVILLARKGPQGASFNEVLQASGAPRGSLYHHFPGGKDELVLAAMDAAGQRAAALLGPVRGQPADKAAEAFISLWRAVLRCWPSCAATAQRPTPTTSPNLTRRERGR